MLQKFQDHPGRMWVCVIGMDDQFSIASSDLSFAPFQQQNKDVSNVMTGVEFDSL
jgi:hypothetical protein